MARLQGITGGLSGKMGSAVFRQAGGQTIATQYQPVVKNPNTEGQQAQRAKFKLMSQLAAIMAPGFGTLGTIKRAGHGSPSKRNAFTNLNFGLVTTQTTQNDVKAKIPMEQVKLTDSFRSLGNLQISENVDGGRSAVIRNIPIEVTAVKFVIIEMPDDATPAIKGIEVVQVENNTATVQFSTLIPAANATVLAYGIIPSAGDVQTSLDNISSFRGTEAVLTLSALENAGSVIDTETLGVNFPAAV